MGECGGGLGGQCYLREAGYWRLDNRSRRTGLLQLRSSRSYGAQSRLELGTAEPDGVCFPYSRGGPLAGQTARERPGADCRGYRMELSPRLRQGQRLHRTGPNRRLPVGQGRIDNGQGPVHRRRQAIGARLRLPVRDGRQLLRDLVDHAPRGLGGARKLQRLADDGGHRPLHGHRSRGRLLLDVHQAPELPSTG